MAVVSRQNNEAIKYNNEVKHKLCITNEKLDYNANSCTGKNTSAIHEAISLIQSLLTISNPDVILSHSEWAYV